MCISSSKITNRKSWRHFRFFPPSLFDVQSTSIWLPSPKYLKLAFSIPFTSSSFPSILFQAVFVSWTNVTPSNSPKQICSGLSNAYNSSVAFPSSSGGSTNSLVQYNGKVAWSYHSFPIQLLLTLFSYTLCSSHIPLTALSGMDSIPSCLQMFAYALSFLWNISYFLLSLWCPLTYSCVSYKKTGLTWLPGSPLDLLSLLAEYGSWSPSYLYKSTYYTALVVDDLLVCFSH